MPANWVPKIHQGKEPEAPRLIGCPAWPTAGLLAGASVSWCRQARGKMARCATCDWKGDSHVVG